MASELRTGGLIRLRLRRGSLLTWLLPGWVVACGALASGELAPTLEDVVRLLLGVLLVDAGWGAVWEALAATDWAAPIRRWRHWRLGDPPFSLPYARPGSPGDRAARWLAQLYAWGKGVLMPTVGRALGEVLAGLFLSFALAVVLGPELVALTFGALALVQLALLQRRGTERPTPGWDGAVRLGLPWLAGHLLFAPLSLPSALAAAAFAVAAVGVEKRDGGWGWTLGIAGQLGGTLLLLLLRRPLAASFSILFLIPQWLLLTQRGGGRRVWGWFAAGMLLVALAL